MVSPRLLPRRHHRKMALLLLTVAALFTSGSALPSSGVILDCPPGFSLLGGRCYLVSEEAYTGAGARRYCRDLNASVAVVEEQEQMDLLAGSLLESTVFLGVDLTNREEIVRGVLKSAGHSGYMNFKQLEPNNDGGEDCVVAAAEEGFRWLDVHCSTPYKVLCETYAIAKIETNCDDDAHKYDEKTCFWLSNVNSNFTFEEAGEECETRGMKLASIHSSDEQTFVSELITVDTWIALNDIEEEDNFVWTDETPLDFTWWGEGEPNNANREDCVEITLHHGHDNEWNDFSCSSPKSALCRGPTH